MFAALSGVWAVVGCCECVRLWWLIAVFLLIVLVYRFFCFSFYDFMCSVVVLMMVVVLLDCL